MFKYYIPSNGFFVPVQKKGPQTIGFLPVPMDVKMSTNEKFSVSTVRKFRRPVKIQFSADFSGGVLMTKRRGRKSAAALVPRSPRGFALV